jgi:hypothetical protein
VRLAVLEAYLRAVSHLVLRYGEEERENVSSLLGEGVLGLDGPTRCDAPLDHPGVLQLLEAVTVIVLAGVLFLASRVYLETARSSIRPQRSKTLPEVKIRAGKVSANVTLPQVILT